jgi:hypothetical protein
MHAPVQTQVHRLLNCFLEAMIVPKELEYVI